MGWRGVLVGLLRDGRACTWDYHRLMGARVGLLDDVGLCLCDYYGMNVCFFCFGMCL